MRINRLLIAGIVSVGLLTSCASDNDVKSTTTKETSAKIAISMSGASVSSTTKTSASTTGDEATLNRLTVGLFDANGNKISITELSSSDFSTTSGTTTATVTGTTLATDVVIAANAATGIFDNVKTKSAFLAITSDLNYTSSADASSTGGALQYSTALPMEGEGTVTISGTAGTASVPLTRLVSKISLAGVTTSFDASGAYAGATFTPTEVFLYNVPSTTQFNHSSPYVSSPTYLQGEIANTTNYEKYLGSGSISTLSTPYTFYTFPNNTTSKTKLVIKGTFTPSGGTAVTVYYPVIINHVMTGTTTDGTTAYTADGGTDGLIQPNKVFNISVTITSKGVSSVTDEITNANVTLTVTVNDWASTLTQNVIF